MSLTKEQPRFPESTLNARLALFAEILAIKAYVPAIAATFTVGEVASQQLNAPGTGAEAYIHAAPAAGESISIDITKNGVSILAAAKVIDSTTPVGTVAIPYSAAFLAAPVINPYDEVKVVGTYVAGGGPGHPGISFKMLLQPNG